MAKYSKGAQKSVESAMRRKKKGALKSGRSGKNVTSRKQAVAIGLSEAREKGARVPSKKSAGRKSATKKSASKKSATKRAVKKSAGRKTATKKSATKKSAVKKAA